MRVKRKKEEMVRIRSLVDLAYSMDPRVAAFKQEEVERKAAAKKAKQDAARAVRAEQEKVRFPKIYACKHFFAFVQFDGNFWLLCFVSGRTRS